uniref:hypothetical protein n=1 Tax=Mycolicibacterium farcinogenes TaxID=1802 RepID=UPI0011AEB7C5|nr:hypothetical protein [Mycolicibacterium farcinogenes]
MNTSPVDDGPTSRREPDLKDVQLTMRAHTPSAHQALDGIELGVADAAFGGVAFTPDGRLRAEIANQLVTGYPEAESRPHMRRIGPPSDMSWSRTRHTVGGAPSPDPV